MFTSEREVYQKEQRQHFEVIQEIGFGLENGPVELTASLSAQRSS